MEKNKKYQIVFYESKRIKVKDHKGVEQEIRYRTEGLKLGPQFNSRLKCLVVGRLLSWACDYYDYEILRRKDVK